MFEIKQERQNLNLITSRVAYTIIMLLVANDWKKITFNFKEKNNQVMIAYYDYALWKLFTYYVMLFMTFEPFPFPLNPLVKIHHIYFSWNELVSIFIKIKNNFQIVQVSLLTHFRWRNLIITLIHPFYQYQVVLQ